MNWNSIFGPTYTPLFSTKSIDFGTMAQLRQLAIEIQVGMYQRPEDISRPLTAAVDCLHYGSVKSQLEEIKVTLKLQRVKYTGAEMFSPVNFTPLRGLRLDSLQKKHPLIQSVKFCLITVLVQRNFRPELNEDSRTALKERVGQLIFDSVMTVPGSTSPNHRSLLPIIHVSIKGR